MTTQIELARARKLWRISGISIICSLILAGGATLLVVLFLTIIGETPTHEARVRQQHALDALYHSPFLEPVAYKEALLRYHRPEIAVIGTSRAGPFRQPFFSAPFVNLQSTVDSPSELHEFIARNFAGRHRPQHLIIVAELSWFADDPVDGRRPHQGRSPEEHAVAVHQYLTAHSDSAARLQALTASILRGGGTRFMGLHGHLRREGFSAFGSFHYEQLLTGRRVSIDQGFSFSLGAIQTGEHRFRWGEALNEGRYAQFFEGLDMLDHLGIDYTVILPPFATTVARAMQDSGRFQHWPALVDQLQKDGVPIFDYSLPTRIGEDDCEYIDGFHGGDVVYARLLADVVRRDPRLSRFVDIPTITRISDEYAGSAAWSRRTPEREIDFLDLGCERPAARDH